MPVWQWLLDIVGLLLLLPVLYGVGLIVRRRWIARHGGTFELSVRVRTTRPGHGWVLGIGRYSGDQLEWFRIFSILPGPSLTWSRSELGYSGRRDPIGHEEMSLYAGHLVVSCHTVDGPMELAMSEASLTGFQAWLESGPPGVDWDHGGIKRG